MANHRLPSKEARIHHKKLKAMGFTLVRFNGHLIYRHANGKTLTVHGTSSCRRAWKNVMANATKVAA